MEKSKSNCTLYESLYLTGMPPAYKQGMREAFVATWPNLFAMARLDTELVRAPDGGYQRVGYAAKVADTSRLDEALFRRKLTEAILAGKIVSLDLEHWENENGTKGTARQRLYDIVKEMYPFAEVGHYDCREGFDRAEPAYYTHKKHIDDLQKRYDWICQDLDTLKAQGKKIFPYISPQVFGTDKLITYTLEGAIFWEWLCRKINDTCEGCIPWGFSANPPLTYGKWMEYQPYWIIMQKAFHLKPIPAPHIYQPGDMNLDGKVNSLDITGFGKKIREG